MTEDSREVRPTGSVVPPPRSPKSVFCCTLLPQSFAREKPMSWIDYTVVFVYFVVMIAIAAAQFRFLQPQES